MSKELTYEESLEYIFASIHELSNIYIEEKYLVSIESKILKNKTKYEVAEDTIDVLRKLEEAIEKAKRYDELAKE